MTAKKKKPAWVKPHHFVTQNLLSLVLAPYTRWKYNIDITPFRENPRRPVCIIMNHQTGWDQFFVSTAFPKPIYFIASEDIFSLGWVSRLIDFLAAPIPIKKQTTDLRAVRTVLQAAREGGSIGLAPEGNRTFSGELCYINPALLGLIRRAGLPVACFRIEGGFGMHPRWSDVLRKGSMKAYVSRVIEPEEYKALSDEELMEIIRREIGVNEACLTSEYHSPQSAEYMERAIYVCPECGLSRFESHGQTMTCSGCGLTVRYLPTKELELVSGGSRAVAEDRPFPFRFLADWYNWQGDFIRGLDLEPYFDTPLYEDTARLSEVILYKKKQLISEKTRLTLYGNRIAAAAEDGDFAQEWNFDEITAVTVLGKNKVNIYADSKVYQIKPDKRFNALRYVNIFNHYKATSKGENDGKQFLGL